MNMNISEQFESKLYQERLEALKSINISGNKDECIEYFFQALDDPSGSVRAYAAKSLSRQWDPGKRRSGGEWAVLPLIKAP